MPEPVAKDSMSEISPRISKGTVDRVKPIRQGSILSPEAAMSGDVVNEVEILNTLSLLNERLSERV